MRITEKHTSYPFMQGGGEMGRRTREFDWKSTTLGNPPSWPQSLKTILSVLLNSRFPMFLWWGPDLIQFYNDAYRPSLGNEGKHPTALGQCGKDCWPEIWSIIKPLINQVLTVGEATWSEDQLVPIYRNGKIEDVYWTFSYSPVRDDNGKIDGVLVVCNETTEKVLNLAALEESEDQLRFAIDAAELGTWDYNPMTNQFAGNQRLRKWFGLPQQGELDLSLALNSIAEKDRARIETSIREALDFSSGGFYDVEYTVIHTQTKKERIVRAKGRAWFSEEKIPYRFNGTLQDVTQQAMARERAEMEERRTRLAVESADLGTYEIDLLTDAIITSDRFNAIWGVERTVPRSAFAAMIHHDDRPARVKAHEESINTGKLYYEARIIRKDQSVHWIRVNGNVLYDPDGKPHYLLGVIKDITSQKELERHKDGFISMVSHELKTPLTSIFGYAQMSVLRAANSGDEQLHKMTTKVNELVQRLNYIVQDLVDVSRIENGKLRFREDHFDLSDLVAQIVEETQMGDASHEIVLEQEPGTRIFADKERTSQVITNFISNAIKYSPEGSRIHVSTSRQKNEIICAVKDSGVGIPKENIAMVFERYYQVQSSQSPNSGLGLGLYISSEIIRRQNGRIWVESEPGLGSTFYFSLPCDSTAKSK